MPEERTFSDMSGAEWRVHEVSPSGTHGREAAQRDQAQYAEPPVELWFTSVRGEQRVLTPVPADWRTAFADTLAYYCDQARPVERGAP